MFSSAPGMSEGSLKSDSKSQPDFLALHFGQTTMDTQWQREGGAIVPGALQLCKQVQQHSFDFTSL